MDTQASSFYGHVTLGLMIHFFLFKSTQCFQNMFFYQFMHSSESILGVRENFHSIHPSGVYIFFQQNPLFWLVNFFKEKLEVISFQKCAVFSAERYIFSPPYFFPFLSYYHLFISFFLFFSLNRSCRRRRTLPIHA